MRLLGLRCRLGTRDWMNKGLQPLVHGRRPVSSVTVVSMSHLYPTRLDPNDNLLSAMIRDCEARDCEARAGNAEALVTGDKALLDLKTFASVPILSASAFVEMLTR
jgi:predicted nucleic acid-binding protein